MILIFFGAEVISKIIVIYNNNCLAKPKNRAPTMFIKNRY